METQTNGANGASDGKDCICMFTPTADGGHARYSWELLTALARQPRGQFCFELVSSEDLQPEFHSELYPHHAILPKLKDRSLFPSKWAWIVSRLLHYPRREFRFLKWLRTRPDIKGVHFQEWTPWLAGSVFARIRAMGKKVFYTVHNVVPHKYPRFVPKPLMHLWIRRACLSADGLFVHTDRLAEQLAKFIGEPHPPIHVVPHGVWSVRENTKPASAPPPPPSLAERLSWKKLLFFGTIRRNKGLDLLLSAVEQLPGYSVTIAGEPLEPQYFNDVIVPQVRRLQAAGVKIDLRDRFTPEDEVGPLFAAHSAIMLPYTKAFVAQSGVLFMALAHEMPVVASEVGGLGDLFSEFKLGTMFHEHTPDALAAAVRELESSGAGLELAEQFKAARRRYSWPQAAAATIAGYTVAIQPAPARQALSSSSAPLLSSSRSPSRQMAPLSAR